MKRRPPEEWQERVVSLAGRRDRRELLQTADARGWAVQRGGLQWTLKTPLYVYLLDTADDSVVMGVVNWEDLSELVGSIGGLSWEETPDALTGILAEIDTKTASSEDERRRRNEILITLAMRYLTGTDTFRRIHRNTPDTHFIVLVYRPKGAGDREGILRPFALVARDRQGPLQPGDLAQVARPVIEQDRVAHPDWFPSAKILEL